MQREAGARIDTRFALKSRNYFYLKCDRALRCYFPLPLRAAKCELELNFTSTIFAAKIKTNQFDLKFSILSYH